MVDQLSADQQFQVGEIVVLAVATTGEGSKRLGEDREIMAQPKPFSWINPHSGGLVKEGKYSVRTPDGEYRQVFPWQLKRKKAPPAPLTERHATETAT